MGLALALRPWRRCALWGVSSRGHSLQHVLRAVKRQR